MQSAVSSLQTAVQALRLNSTFTASKASATGSAASAVAGTGASIRDTRKTTLEFRKHLGWYTRGLPGSADLRQRLFAIESMREAEAIFAAYLTEHAPLASAAA